MLESRTFLLALLISVASAEIQSVKVEECAGPCKYNDTSYHMNCTKAECTKPPVFDISGGIFFNSLYDMKTLLLKDNSIGNLTAFVHYPYLERIDLSNSQITIIEEGAFEDCDILKVLCLAHNKIRQLSHEYFRGLHNLEQLDLRNNQIESVEDNVFHWYLGNLQRLDLSRNRIKTISANAFTDLPELKFLHIEDNLLYSIDSRDFLGLRSLEGLYLRGNILKSLSNSTFIQCKRLDVLDLRLNYISNMEPNAFMGLDHLQVLHLSGNLIKKISGGVFLPLLALEDVYLDDNPVEVIMPESFPKSLQKLSMQNMTELRIIHNDTFTGLLGLHTVEITDSKNFVLLDAGAFDQKNSTVFVLDLFNNSLGTLYENLVNWSMIKTMDLGKNRWTCDCEMAWVKHSKEIPNDVKDTMKCYEPFHLHGKRISDVDFEQFSCSFYDVHRGGIEAAIIFLVTVIFIALAGLLIYKFRHVVFMCFYNKPGKYSTMYNAVNTEEDETVEIKWKKETDKTAPAPASV